MVESLLGRIKDYDNIGDFDFISALDELNEAKTALEGLQTVLEEMEDSDRKTALEEKLKEWSPIIEEAENDLASLPDEIVTKLKFEYDLAELQQMIDEYNKQWEMGNKSAETGAARNIAKENYREKREEQTGYNEDSDKAYGAAYEKIATLTKELAKAKTEETRQDIQEQMSAILDMQNAFQDALVNGEATDWEQFFNTENAQQLMKNLVESGELTKTELEELFNVKLSGFEVVNPNAPQHLEVEIGTSLSKEKVEEQLAELTAGSTIEFTASLDGVEKQVKAIKHEDGTITYELVESGAKIELNKEGTIAYRLSEQEDPTPRQTFVEYLMGGQAQPVPKEAEVDYKRGSQEDPKDRTAYVTYRTRAGGGAGQLEGTAHLEGTAYANGTLNDSQLKDHWKTSKGEVALTGEEGVEIVAHGNEWWTVGDEGAEFNYIPQDSVVFNAEQTKELLEKGKINSRGKSYLGGTAYLGSADGSFNFDGGASNYNTGSKSSSKSSDKSKDKSSDETVEKFDWIERALKKVQRAIENLEKTAGATYKKWSARNKAISQEILKVNDEIELQQKAYNRYKAEANSVGLSKKYRNLVQNGKIDIDTIKNESLKEKIEEYQDWYNKMCECQDAIKDLRNTEAELYTQLFENIVSKYDEIFERYDWRQSMLDEYVKQAEEQGQMISSKYYQKMISNEKNRIGYLKRERDELYDALEKGVDAEGNSIQKDSEAWNNMVNQINEVTLAIEESNTAILEFENSIRDLEWAQFDLLQDKISNITDEADFLIELMSDEKLVGNDGKLTDEGMATLGLRGQNYNTYMEQSKLLSEEIKNIEAEIAKDPNNQDLIERKEELLDLQREAILNAESEKDAIKSLVQDGINAEIDSMQKLADEYLEALRNAEDLYDYQKRIQSLTKKHAALQKQLLALENDSSEENKTRLQSLRVQLEESQSDIEDAEREQAFKDTEKLVNTVVEEFTDTLNARLDNVDALIEQMIHEANMNATSINTTLEEQADFVGYTLSEEIQSIWNGADGEKSVLTTYGDGITSELTTVNSTLNVMNTNLQSMITQLNKIAETDVKGLAAQNAYNSDEATPDEKKTSASTNKNTTTSTSSNKPSSSSSSGDGKITKGEIVTFNSGKYTAQSDGGGASGKQKLGEKVYVTSIKSGAERPYHISQDKAGKKPLGWVKKSQLKGYSTGAKFIDEDQLAWLNEYGNIESYIRQRDGAVLRVMSEGDRILNPKATANLYDLANDPTKYFAQNIGLEKLSAISALRDYSNYEYSGDMNINVTLPNVMNYEEFRYALEHDRKFEQSVRAMTVDRLFGKSHLRKYTT